ncbi:hypothetical protein WA026_001486 [Henosepilachna vigintioctopunctata]|uniref:Cyclic nucleotide-binding domain-containing protein n=1 Tax=Henosepilachna vigintioctopunctata TaxID=420089 RepID=A0AAW1UU04_9CUCU
MVKLNLDDAAYYRVKKVKGHKCILNYEPNTVDYHVTSGIFVQLRRFFRKSIVISERDPRTKAYLKSITSIILEEKRHLEHFYYMIHPFSDFHFIWQTIMTIVHLIALTVVPVYYMARSGQRNTHIAPLNRTLCFICLINVVLSFFIGYFDQSKSKVVLRPKKVIRRYLITYFFFDLLSSVNYNFYAKMTNLYKPSWYMRFQWSLKLVRLITINEYLDTIQMRLGLPNYLYSSLKCGMFTIVIFLWLNYFTYAVDYHFSREVSFEDLASIFLTSANKNLQILFFCDIFKMYYNIIYASDLYLIVTTLHVGKFFEIWLLAQFFQVFASYTVVKQKYQTMIYQVEAFTRFKDLPKRMCRRIYSYLNFRFQCLIFNENFLIDNLCVALKDQILWHKCQYLVTKVQTFAELPSPIMLKLATMLKPEIYLPNDVVVHSGEVGSEMFFVYVGVLAVFTESGKEICHLSDGSHFGEIALLLNEPRVASVVAIDFCELYRLTKHDFQEAIEPYPLVKENIMKAAQERFRETRSIAQQSNSL